jgi:nicotinate-nucleotide adenylyltransferase
MTIGLFGGTFDPLHFGHLNLAIEIMEERQLDEVWFIPAQISPHKLHQQPVSPEHRLAMLQLAIADIPQFRIVDFELQRPGTSYTVDTISALLSQEKSSSHREFGLILGDDAVLNFFRRRDPDRIVEMVKLFIGCRSPSIIDLDAIKGDPAIIEAIRHGITNTKIMDICSTDIRQRISSGLYCGHLVPAKVLDYIYENRLYLKL